MTSTAPALQCTVELFGVARLAAGRVAVTLAVPRGATLADALAALAQACPTLVGKAIAADGVALLPGHVLNLDGRTFVDDLSQPVRPGERILLLSDQAGG